MYNSLSQHCKDFHLYVFAFNKKCYSVLQALQLKNVTVISLSEFEDEELLRVKSTRTRNTPMRWKPHTTSIRQISCEMVLAWM